MINIALRNLVHSAGLHHESLLTKRTGLQRRNRVMTYTELRDLGYRAEMPS